MGAHSYASFDPRGNCGARRKKSRLACALRRGMTSNAMRPDAGPLRLLSVVIPARDEEGCIASTVEHLYVELNIHGVPHEIVVVDDGSTDNTWEKLTKSASASLTLRPIQNAGPHGFGRAIIRGFDYMNGRRRRRS